MWEAWILSGPQVDRTTSRTLFSRVVLHGLGWACLLVDLSVRKLFMDHGCEALEPNHRFLSGFSVRLRLADLPSEVLTGACFTWGLGVPGMLRTVAEEIHRHKCLHWVPGPAGLVADCRL